IALEKNFEIVELDDTNMEQALSIGETSSLYGNRKLILIENVDTAADIKKVTTFLEKTKNPTVLTTADFKSKRLKTIKNMCFEVQLRRPQAATIANHLKEICRKESITAEEGVLLTIANNSKGDLRVAITDLETTAKDRKHIREKDLEVLYQRDVEGDIYKALSVIYSGKDINEVVESTWDLNEEPKNVIYWIEENTPNVIQEPIPLSNAFHFLSKADVFLGRIMRRQYWGFLRYANALMTAGVNASKEKVRYAMYRFPSYFMKMGSSKGDRNMADNIGEKMKARIHASKKTIAKEDIPMFRILLKKGKIDAENLTQEYQLSEEEIAYIGES
ncbi:MAG: hypothetical protein FJY77_05075, partial [Candidatus Altiarchaeales archaeon]|nr:hypothetical protein [Candidatus Altiarchaeales archaeon]